MFKNTFQSGLLSVFHSIGANPLTIWETHVQNGHIKRLTDPDVNSIVLEIIGTNVATTYMTTPKTPPKDVKCQGLGIRLPFMVMIVKNLKRYFSFEVAILDDRNMRRRFRISNFQSSTKIRPFCTTMPIGLSGGWNQIQLNLCDFTKRAYGTQYIETNRITINANARLRRIYFCDRLYTEEELPKDYKLYLPLDKKGKKTEQETPTKPPEPETVKLSKASLVEAVVEEGQGEPKAEQNAEAEAAPEEKSAEPDEKSSEPDEKSAEPDEEGEGAETKSMKSEYPGEGAETKTVTTEMQVEEAEEAKSISPSTAPSMPGEGGIGAGEESEREVTDFTEMPSEGGGSPGDATEAGSPPSEGGGSPGDATEAGSSPGEEVAGLGADDTVSVKTEGADEAVDEDEEGGAPPAAGEPDEAVG